MQLVRAQPVEAAALVLGGDVAQHHVDGLHAARGLLGDHARLRLQLAIGVVGRDAVAAHDVPHRHCRDRGNEQAAEPGNALPRPAARLRGLGRLGKPISLAAGNVAACSCARGRRANHVRRGHRPAAARSVAGCGRIAIFGASRLRSRLDARCPDYICNLIRGMVCRSVPRRESPKPLAVSAQDREWQRHCQSQPAHRPRRSPSRRSGS